MAAGDRENDGFREGLNPSCELLVKGALRIIFEGNFCMGGVEWDAREHVEDRRLRGDDAVDAGFRLDRDHARPRRDVQSCFQSCSRGEAMAIARMFDWKSIQAQINS